MAENIVNLSGVSGKKNDSQNDAQNVALNGISGQEIIEYFDKSFDKVVNSIVSVSDTFTQSFGNTRKGTVLDVLSGISSKLDVIVNKSIVAKDLIPSPKNVIRNGGLENRETTVKPEQVVITHELAANGFADAISKVVTPEFASALLGMQEFMNKDKVNEFNTGFRLFAKGIADGLGSINKNFDNAIEVVKSLTGLQSVFSTLIGATESQEFTVFGKKFSIVKRKQIFNEEAITDFRNGFISVAQAIGTGLQAIQGATSKRIETLEQVGTFVETLGNVLGMTRESGTNFRLFDMELISFSRSKLLFDKENIDRFAKGTKKIISLFSSFAKDLSKIKLSDEVVSSISVVSDTISKFADDEWKNAGATMRSISVGFALLAGSTSILASTAKTLIAGANGLNRFVDIISSSLSTLGSKDFSAAAENLRNLSSGLATVGLASVEFVALSPVTIAAMGILRLFGDTLNFLGAKEMGESILKFTLSIATLGLSIWAFSEIVSIDGMIKTAGAMALLAGAIYLFNGVGNGKFFGGIKTSSKSPIQTMVAVAGGIALLALSVWAWDELTDGIGAGTYVEVIAALAGIAGTMWLYDKVSGKSTKNILFVAAGVAALGLALKVWEWLAPNPLTAVYAVGAIAGIGGALMLWKTVTPQTAVSMIAIAGGVAALGISFAFWNQIQIPTLLAAGATILALAGIAAIYSNPLTSAGALSMLAVGASVLALSGGLYVLSKIPDTTEAISNFVTSAINLCHGFAEIALHAIPAALGATLMIPVAGSAILVGGSLALIQLLNYDAAKIADFGLAMNALADAYDSLSLVSLTKSVLKSGEMVLVAAASIPVAGLIWLLNKIPIKPDKIKNNFEPSLVALQDAWEELSLLKMTKGAVKAGEMLPLVAGTLAAIRAIREVQNLTIDKPLLDSNLLSMNSFVESVVDVFDNLSDKVEKVKESASGVKTIGDACYALAQAVHAISKLEIVESEVRDGKLVPKNIRKLTDRDFELVSVGVAKMLSSLTNPLLAIAEAGNDDYTIAGIKIAGKNKIKAAVESVSGIGAIFTPMAELITAIGSTELLKQKDTRGAINLGVVLRIITDSLSTFVGKIVALNIGDNSKTNLEGATNGFVKLFNAIQKVDPTGIQSVRNEIDLIFEKIKNDGPWNKMRDNMLKYAGAVLSIKNSINGMDLRKLINLEKLTANLKEANANGNMQRLIEAVAELVNVTQSQTAMLNEGFGNMTSGLGDINSTLQPDATGNTSGFDIQDSVPNHSPSPEPQVSSGTSAADKIAVAINNLTQVVKTKNRVNGI